MRYEVQTLVGDDWDNIWRDNDDVTPLTFDTKEEAEGELAIFLKDLQAEVEQGHLQDFSPDNFRVVGVQA